MTGLAELLLLLMLMRTEAPAAPTPQPVRPTPPRRRRQPRPPIVVYPTPPKPAQPPVVVTPTPAKPPPAINPATSTKTPPWPSVVPKGLPAFPGSGWTPDQPPSPAVVQRAWALLAPLWQKNGGRPGATQTEQTAGRWITYQAVQMTGGKKGVVAFRLTNPAGTSPSAFA